jgi:hypothetical protein
MRGGAKMISKKYNVIAAVLAATLLLSSVPIAHAAVQKPSLNKIDVKQYKGFNTATFKVCAGNQQLSKAGVLVTSKMDAVPLMIKTLSAEKCSTFSVQILAKDLKNINVKLVTSENSEKMKKRISAEINELKTNIGELEKSLTPAGPNNVNGKLAKKIISEEISKINAFKKDVKQLQKTLNALNILSR